MNVAIFRLKNVLAALAILAALVSGPALAVEPTGSPQTELANSQNQLAARYAGLEKLILRMAEFDAADNPRRAELLKRAFALAKKRNVQLSYDQLVALLGQDRLSKAMSNQKKIQVDLNAILTLLLTEDRADRLKDEQARIKQYIRKIERIQRMQRGVQGRTRGGVPTKQLAKEQQRVAEKTQQLNDEIAKNESPLTDPDSTEDTTDDATQDDSGNPTNDDAANPIEEGEPSDGKPSDGEPSDGEPSDGKPSDGEPSDGEPSDGEPSDGEPSDGEPSDGEPSDGKPSNGEPSDGEPSDSGDGSPSDSSSTPPESFPGHDRIQEARDKMKQAQDKLEQSQREEATKDQEEALRKLSEAKAELEEILRQQREEEIERVLALLESRFRKMLEMQLQVYESTVRLYKIPPERRDRFVDIEAGKLSFAERRIVVEAEKCLSLLRDEGSSVAFPESVEQMRDDMRSVENRLGRTQIGRMTQDMEEDILEALDEMIESLQQAQQDQEQRQNQTPQNAPAQQQDQSLVDQIAELKMIKAMQLRINKRTTSYSRLLGEETNDAGQSNDEELIEALQELSDRELRLQEITHDIVIKKNR